MQFKSKTFSHFLKFKNLIENQTGLTIKEMVKDNGGEYISEEFKNLTKIHGIKMSLTAPYTPQQNPIAEIGNRTTTEKARALLKQACLPAEFWAEAVNTAVYLENITPIASRDWKSPFDLWHKTKPKYDHLRVFGFLAYVHIGKERRNGKFGDVAERGVHLGYQDGKHNYRIWLINKKRVVYSHDVLFDESIFPFSLTNNNFIDEDDEPLTPSDTPVQPTADTTAPTGAVTEDESPATEDSSSDFSSNNLIVPPTLPAPDSPTAPLKPSFTYVPASAPAPQNITSSINEDNILSHRRRANAAAAYHSN